MHQQLDAKDNNDQYLFFDDKGLCEKIDEIFRKNNNKKMQKEVLELRISQIKGEEIVLEPNKVWTRHGFDLLRIKFYDGITYKLDAKGYIYPRITRQLDIKY